ncbi:hypothetical protein [Microtetraspora malaysiensis]|uniref:Uncharacterized protein n=1 Tax=Microtetraspora malaysiensis TaxID=161358 RepID=A0ABW6SKR6_9ACTN
MAVRQLRPRTVEDWVRDVMDRLRVIEHRTTVVVGTAPNAYVLEVDSQGRLTARHATTGTITVIASP